MNCEVCEQEEAVVTLIPTGSEGMPQSVGSACFARFGLETAKQVLPAEEIAGILGPMFVQPPAKAPAAKAPKSKPGKAAKAPEADTAPEGSVGGPDEEPTAAADA